MFFLFMSGYIGLSHPLKGTCPWVALSEVWSLGVTSWYGHTPVVTELWMGVCASLTAEQARPQWADLRSR